MGGLALALAGCKMPTLAASEKAGPPPQQVASSKAAPPCACADGARYGAASGVTVQDAKPLPQSIHAAQPAPATARRPVRTEQGAQARYQARGRRTAERSSETYGARDYAGAAVAGDTEYAGSSRSYEEHTYQGEQSSRSYVQSGYVQEGGDGQSQAEQDYGQGGDGFGSHFESYEYIVRRPVRGDAERSRAWTRVGR